MIAGHSWFSGSRPLGIDSQSLASRLSDTAAFVAHVRRVPMFVVGPSRRFGHLPTSSGPVSGHSQRLAACLKSAMNRSRPSLDDKVRAAGVTAFVPSERGEPSGNRIGTITGLLACRPDARRPWRPTDGGPRRPHSEAVSLLQAFNGMSV
jgi:hypothetical protein